ncbi:N-acetylmuramoyl-L-alanine amidase [Intestinibacillus massiliensis]|nr:N-acetylmuramoyl-L-alanine amidase [Intestinibacillus massiliensis]
MKMWTLRIRTVLWGGIAVALAAVIAVFFRTQGAAMAFSPWTDERTLVIDAGHGGFDGGAIGSGGTTEQHINLSVAKRTQALAGFFGIQTAMTRSDENALGYQPGRAIRENKVADIKMREKIVNETPDPVFISIHLNKFEQGKYWGAQVFYSKGNEEGMPLGETVQQCLIDGLNKENHRKAKQAADTIYLMKKLQCPAIIVECGFLSNPEEEQLLQQTEYHKRLAICIVSGYLQHLASTDA